MTFIESRTSVTTISEHSATYAFVDRFSPHVEDSFVAIFSPSACTQYSTQARIFVTPSRRLLSFGRTCLGPEYVDFRSDITNSMHKQAEMNKRRCLAR